jgi:hypothetical protein
MPPTFTSMALDLEIKLDKGWLHAVVEANGLTAEIGVFVDGLFEVASRKFGVDLNGENTDPLKLRGGPKNMLGIAFSELFRSAEVFKFNS